MDCLSQQKRVYVCLNHRWFHTWIKFIYVLQNYFPVLPCAQPHKFLWWKWNRQDFEEKISLSTTWQKCKMLTCQRTLWQCLVYTILPVWSLGENVCLHISGVYAPKGRSKCKMLIQRIKPFDYSGIICILAGIGSVFEQLQLGKL